MGTARASARTARSGETLAWHVGRLAVADSTGGRMVNESRHEAALIPGNPESTDVSSLRSADVAVAGAYVTNYAPEFSIPGVSPECFRQPEGVIAYRGSYPGLHDDVTAPVTLFEIVAGAHLFRMRRDPGGMVRAVHASPGGGTRVAELELAPLAPSEVIVVILRWTPESLDLDLSRRPVDVSGHPLSLLARPIGWYSGKRRRCS